MVRKTQADYLIFIVGGHIVAGIPMTGHGRVHKLYPVAPGTVKKPDNYYPFIATGNLVEPIGTPCWQNSD